MPKFEDRAAHGKKLQVSKRDQSREFGDGNGRRPENRRFLNPSYRLQKRMPTVLPLLEM